MERAIMRSYDLQAISIHIFRSQAYAALCAVPLFGLVSTLVRQGPRRWKTFYGCLRTCSERYAGGARQTARAYVARSGRAAFTLFPRQIGALSSSIAFSLRNITLSHQQVLGDPSAALFINLALSTIIFWLNLDAIEQSKNTSSRGTSRKK